MSDCKAIRDELRAQGFLHAKKWGQNFLWDEALLARICAAADVGERPVVEIGPGAGMLTRALAQSAPQVLAVEIDKRLEPVLDVALEGFRNVRLCFGDAMQLRLDEIARETFGDTDWECVANLPYYITTPILMRLLESAWPIARITVMVQKEVAQRMIARPGRKDYGALSVAVQYRAKAQIVLDVPAGAFSPPPNVDSCVVRMDLYAEKPVQPRDEALFLRVARSAFAMRRKTMANNLCMALGIEREKAEAALRHCGIDAKARGETLDIQRLAALSDYFSMV